MDSENQKQKLYTVVYNRMKMGEHEIDVPIGFMGDPPPLEVGLQMHDESVRKYDAIIKEYCRSFIIENPDAEKKEKK